MQKTFFLNSAVANYGEEEFNYIQKFLLEQGILNTEGADYNDFADLKVSQHSTGDMTVDVAKGVAVIETIRNSVDFKVFVANQAIENLVITNNTSGSNRVDTVILKLSRTATPNALMSNVASLEVVAGDGVSALSDGDIQTAIGASYDFIRLADITVASGATQILTADIADTRERCYNTDVAVPNPTIIKFRQLTADPTTPVEGEMWYNTTDNLLRYFDGSNTINIQASSYTGGNGITVSAGIISVDLDDDDTFIETNNHELVADVLLVAGGGGAGAGMGGGGDYHGGGGGGGGLINKNNVSIPLGTYNITIGNGGKGVIDGLGTNGENTSFMLFTAVGGGGGGMPNSVNGLDGGSAGGAGINSTVAGVGGSATQPKKYWDNGTYGYGYKGGNSASTGKAGGGGGAGGAGQTASTSSGVASGGVGLEVWGVTYAKGGDGNNGGGTAGTANTGNGGNAPAYNVTAKGGDGGSGVAVIRYKTSNYSHFTITGGTITTVGEYTYHTFTSTGTLSVSETTPTDDSNKSVKVNLAEKIPADLLDNSFKKTIDDFNLILDNMFELVASETLKTSSDAEVSSGASEADFVKRKEIMFNAFFRGRIRVKYAISESNTSANAFFQLRKNGVMLYEDTQNSTTYTTKTYDIDVEKGDLIQIYIKNTASNAGRVKEFRLYYNLQTKYTKADTVNI